MVTEPKGLKLSTSFIAVAEAGEEIGVEALSIKLSVTENPGNTTSWGRGREQR